MKRNTWESRKENAIPSVYGNQYKHLTMADRDIITELLYEGKTISEIANAIGRHKSTISRELKRNSSPVQTRYFSHRAQFRADQRRTEACCRLLLKNDPTREYVQGKAKEFCVGIWKQATINRIDLPVSLIYN
ncbi:MAG: helix-turn-helix domain-containing protein [Candidatus Brocadiales bacterium]